MLRASVSSFSSLLLMGANALSAQAVMAGTVRADSSGRRLAGVEVLIEGTALKATTGPNGQYVIDGVPTGRQRVLFRSVGYFPERLDVFMAAGDTTVANALLVARAVVLESIAVLAKAPRGEGREAFEERRRLGFGKFYDSVMLRKSEHLRIQDVLRRLGSIELRKGFIPGEHPNTWVAFNPNRQNPLGGLNCPMQVYYNGSKVGEGGTHARPERWLDLTLFDIASLESIEVYRSAGQVPGIYGGPTADCGVILLWSRQH